jgi:Arc/MetJ family transcription regulator
MKTVIDLDSELTEAAAKVLGTRTKKDTVRRTGRRGRTQEPAASSIAQQCRRAGSC